jgi:hypothetical protein
MDQDRQIRFLIPPFFLYASLLWWAFVDPRLHCFLTALAGNELKEILAVAATLGAATIPLGFSIGTLGLLLLKLAFHVRSRISSLRRIHEAYITEECFRVILRETAAPTTDDRRSLLYATATFDHELLPEGIHTWLMRRWNTFNVAFSSAIAIFISLLAALALASRDRTFDPLCGLSDTEWQRAGWSNGQCWWLGANCLLLFMLLCSAWISWARNDGYDRVPIEAKECLSTKTEEKELSFVKRKRPRCFRNVAFI